jgi:hypothetical protein
MRVWTSPAALALYLAVAAQGFVAWTHRDLRPDFDIIGPAPTAAARTAMAFGDEQLLYRIWVLNLQNDGDTGGRATPMRDYNYDYVLDWLETLGALDPLGQHHLMLAANYFSYTPSKADVRRLVDFIAADVAHAPNEKWYWLTQAISMADTKAGDLPLALALAQRLAAYDPPTAPHYIWMLPAVLLEKMGRRNEAESAMEEVRKQRWNVLTDDERRYLDYFIQRLHDGVK